MSSTALDMCCPGCGKEIPGSKGFLNHLKQSANIRCKQAYHKILTIGVESSSASEVSSDESDISEMYPRAQDSLPEAELIEDPMDIEANSPDNSDFFGSLEEPMEENLDIELDLDLDDFQADDLTLGPIPELEDDDSDSEEEQEFYWYVKIILQCFHYEIFIKCG